MLSLFKGLRGLSLGFSVGCIGVFGILREKEYQFYYSSLYEPISSHLSLLVETIKYYTPTNIKERQLDHSLRTNQYRSTQYAVNETESNLERRRRIRFRNDLHKRLRNVQLVTTQKGLSIKEKREIVYQCLLEHYPELTAETTKKFLEESEI